MSLSALSWSLEQQVSPPAAKLLLIILSQYADERNECCPSIDQLELDCSVTRTTVISASERLVDLGYLVKEIRAGGASGGSETTLYRLRRGDSIVPKQRKTRKTTKKFQKPTPEQVETYGNSINFAINGQNFINFYESKGWKVGNTPMRDWKAAVRTWKQRRKDEPRKRDFASNLFGDGEMDMGQISGKIWEQMDQSMAGPTDDAFGAGRVGQYLEQIPAWTDQASDTRLDGTLAANPAGTGRTLEASPSSPEDVFFAQTKAK